MASPAPEKKALTVLRHPLVLLSALAASIAFGLFGGKVVGVVRPVG